jgi:uroporphyrinogen-III decarboxylase
MENTIDKTKQRLDAWYSAHDIEFVDIDAEEQYKARVKRISDAIQLKKPDRVPVTPLWEYFYPVYDNITCQEAYYDIELARKAAKKTITELEPDAYEPPVFLGIGPVLDALGTQQVKWPGNGIPADKGHQYVENEYMKAEEYSEYIDDTSAFIIRRFLPRVCSNLKALESLTPMHNLIDFLSIASTVSVFGTPEGIETAQTLVEAGKAAVKYRAFLTDFETEMNAMGFPCWLGGFSGAPYDDLSDYYRGTIGIFMDLFQRPETLKTACNKIVPRAITRGLTTSKMGKSPLIFMTLHKGLANSRDGKGGFMSLKHFEEFYWPTLKEVIVGLTEHGLVPNLFFEGDYTSRLEIIKDVPKGQCVYHFENVDLHKAKTLLGDRVCLRGSVPMRTLALGTPQDVRDACKELIDVLGEGGGFIMDASMASEDAKPENMKAMIDFTKEYGVYK